MEIFRYLFGANGFMPHGYCYLWNAKLVSLHVVSDALIALAYLTIPVTLLRLVRKRRDLPFNWIFVLFGMFIVACGLTHVMEIWNLWHADYWLAGAVKAITAAASVGTAIALMHLLPQAVEIPNLSQWIAAHATLEKEIRNRRDIELDLGTSEANYREKAELVDLTHDAMFVRGEGGKITYWNRGAEFLYGWQSHEARGQITHEILQTKFPQPLAEIEAQLAATGYWEGELTHTKRDGGSVVVSSRWAVRHDASGKPHAVLEVNRDISARKVQETRFRNLLETAPDAIVIVGGDGLIQIVNAQTENMFGYSRGELMGQNVELLIPERFRGSHVGHRHGYLKSPRPRSMGAEMDLYGRRKDGTEFPVEVSLSPMETSEGTLISSSIRDVTQKKNAQAALRQSEELFRLLVSGVKDCAIFMLDKSGYISSWSEGAAKISGYRSEEIIGQHFSKFGTPEDIESGRSTRELQIAADEGRFEEEGWRLRKDGTRYWASVLINSLHDEHGSLRGFGKVTRDISERLKAQQKLDTQQAELSKSNAELQVLNKELETFSYSVSHDLRAPLRHIDGFARILKEEHGSQLDEEGLRYLDRVLKAANHMGHLVDDLINLARIGRGAINTRPVSLDEIVRDAIASLPDEAKDPRIDRHIEPLPEHECDPGLLKLVFINLFSNAVKFTRNRSVARIEIGTREVDGITAFFVQDNGVGFDPQYADKLFGVFQRLHNQEDFEGTGIGLATVQRIIRKHGGEIWAEAALNQGATFFFTLGVKPPDFLTPAAKEIPIGRA